MHSELADWPASLVEQLITVNDAWLDHVADEIERQRGGR